MAVAPPLRTLAARWLPHPRRRSIAVAATALRQARHAYVPEGAREVAYDDWGASRNFLRGLGPEKLSYRLFVADGDAGSSATCCLVADIGAPGTEGVPGFLHGGLTSTLLDTAMGNLAWYAGYQRSFTANLTVDFRAPIVPPASVVFEARVDRVEGRKVFLVADAYVLEGCDDSTFVRAESPAAEATALFVVMEGPSSKERSGDGDGSVQPPDELEGTLR